MVVNAIGNATARHKMLCVYVVLGNLDPHLRCLTDNVQLVLLCKNKDFSYFGPNVIFRRLVEDLKVLEEKGIVIPDGNDMQKRVFGSVFTTMNDNLGAHQLVAVLPENLDSALMDPETSTTGQIAREDAVETVNEVNITQETVEDKQEILDLGFEIENSAIGVDLVIENGIIIEETEIANLIPTATEVEAEHIVDTSTNHITTDETSVQKRKIANDLVIEKSTKRHATTDMKFNCFEINWNKISDCVLHKLNAWQEFKNTNPRQKAPANLKLTKADKCSMVNAIIDQLRMISVVIHFETFEKVSKQIINKYSCLDEYDESGLATGKGYVSFKNKLIDRNGYLNRFKTSLDTGSKPVNSKIKRNVQAGTLQEYWLTTSKECSKEIFSNLMRNEPELLTDNFLEESQSFVRYLMDSTPIIDTINKFPVLRRHAMLSFHFMKATGVDGNSMAVNFPAGKDCAIKYSQTLKSSVRLGQTATDYETLHFLCNQLGEKLENIILRKEIGTRLDTLTFDSGSPLLVEIDLGQGQSMFYVFAEQTQLTEGCSDILVAMSELIMSHYTYNFMYSNQASKFLEFIQIYFFKINPLFGSKSTARRINRQQRMVMKIIEKLTEVADI
ncbi:uncharacterized protein LOC129741400 [Uranotaenia lowii]|uniref:uncharacterized protein LOC129741400 n=1 Tax=Uranotaenia lowii TaxID=190385 RepID=UPI002478AA80|nr:uncharacterized protein LOC129741400 [Uranotaenia lowii]